MARLAIRCPGQDERIESLHGDEIRIGRGKQASLRVEDKSLSREHCRLRKTGGAWRVVDLGSQNGTRLNGRQITEEKSLASGDLIQIGRSQLLFVADLPEERDDEAVDAGQTVCLDAIERDLAEPAPDARPAANRESGPRYALQYVKEGRKRFLPLGREPLTIGRHKSCGLILDDASVSTCHARIEWREDGYRIADLGSTNGVLLNGRKTAEGLLRAGTRIRLGNVAIGFKEIVRRPEPPSSAIDEGENTPPCLEAVEERRPPVAAPARCCTPAISGGIEELNEALDRLEERAAVGEAPPPTPVPDAIDATPAAGTDRRNRIRLLALLLLLGGLAAIFLLGN